MNVNEVIPNRAVGRLGGAIGSKRPVHPNDPVDRRRSSSDTFPTATQVAAADGIEARLVPALADLVETLESKAESFKDIIKIGHAHLQDTTWQSIRLLDDDTASFTQHCVVDLAADTARISDLVSRSLMLVTALAPIIGYDEAAHIAKAAHRNGTTLLKEVMAAKIMDKRAFEDAISLARRITRDRE